jgi:hypothetical protein
MIRYPVSALMALTEFERVSTTLRPVLPVAPTINIVGVIAEAVSEETRKCVILLIVQSEEE